MRVDLPAPFWPSSAWTSPCRTSKSIPSSASVPVKRFESPATSSNSPDVAAPSLSDWAAAIRPYASLESPNEETRLLRDTPDIKVVLLVVVARDECVFIASLALDVFLGHQE